MLAPTWRDAEVSPHVEVESTNNGSIGHCETRAVLWECVARGRRFRVTTLNSWALEGLDGWVSGGGGGGVSN